MTADGVRVVLGSASPARLRVLRAAGLRPRVLVSDVDEDALLEELVTAPPHQVVVRLAQAKADAVVAALLAEERPDAPTDETRPDESSAVDTVVLTCDSMLLIDGVLAGKPHTAAVAAERWRSMRGRQGELLTGHCVAVLSGGEVTASAHADAGTMIRFADIDDATIDSYVATGEPLSVAGGFTLDGLGGWFIDGIDGDPSSVLGIGLPTVRALLRRVGIDVTRLWSDTATSNISAGSADAPH
ncbi:Maf family protein [Gordonia soli]|uniref:Maf family protein n=1 Tax=Gordonia soli TaxID=320799 RepID=UPI000344E9E2|nr:nucleoside triphosphate pyrophosphatase [Gordonia soli]